MLIRNTTLADLPQVMAIYARARDFMAATGNPNQWGPTCWPPENLILEDIAEKRGYVCVDEENPDKVLGAFCYIYGQDIDHTYDVIEEGRWSEERAYGVVHRLASNGTRGVGCFCLNWAIRQSGYLRVDTHPDNQVMQNLLGKLGFEKRGIIHVVEDNYPRYAYDISENYYKSFQEELVSLRRHFHQYPEVSEREYETSDFIYQYLTALGLNPKKVAGTGVVAMIWAPDEIADSCETIAVRSEIDAVCVEETNTFPWKSRNPGVSHACGHDAIIACGLVLAKVCMENRDRLPVNVKLLFQPAEENGQGTRLFLEEHVMERPRVDKFIMYHFANDRKAGMEINSGAATAAIGSIILKVKGKASHWGNAAAGIDSILGAAKAVEAIDRVNREFQSKVPHVVGIGMIEGGKAKNVIAKETTLQGTIRSCSLSEYRRLRSILIEELKKAEAETGTTYELFIDEEPIPPIRNDREMMEKGIAVGTGIWGRECRLVDALYLSGDSAAYYFDYAKGIFMVFTARKDGEPNYSLHSGKFDFDESVLWKTVESLHGFILAQES